MSDTYTEDEWAEAAGHRPLAGVDVNHVALLHRHWIWANLQRRRFYEMLREAPSPSEDEGFLTAEAYCSMYLWYALLWSVIEGFQDPDIEFRGQFAVDIERMSDVLRRCRNAVFHVSEGRYWDARLFELMNMPDSAEVIQRISTGFGRLFIEEAQARKES
jgi:hypothetical protein